MDKNSDKSIQFSWLDVPKSIWHFLGENKFRWVWFNLVLFTVLFYDLLPPFIMGKIVDFFSEPPRAYARGISLIQTALLFAPCPRRLGFEYNGG
jgi:hypothetical protein